MGELKLENLPIKALRQRLFVKRSSLLYGKSEYTFDDNAPEQIEKLEGFTNWESFSEEWDVYWAGFDPRTFKWVAGRHHSPIREVILPLRIIKIDERNKRMQDTFEDKKDILKLKIPTKNYPETDADRIISESLSGKVVVDEADADKARRLLQDNIKELAAQLEILTAMAQKLH